MKSIFCTTKHHQQDTPTYCGPAVAQMFLARLETHTRDQRTLAGNSSENVGSNGTSLGGMIKILNDGRPAGFDGAFMPNQLSDREAGIKLIVDTLVATRLPVPVLTYGGNPHWMLVTGAAFDEEQQPGGAFPLRGFYLANPAPVTATLVRNGALKKSFPGHPTPHDRTDNCGKGGLQGGRYAYVSADSWRRHQWPDPKPGARPRPFTAITTSHAPSEADLRAAPIEVVSPPLAATSPIIDPDAAKAAAQSAVHGSGLDLCEPFKSAFAGAQAAEATHHDIVTDAGDETWYLVTFTRGPNPVCAVFVEAAGGRLVGAMAPVTVVISAAELRQFVYDELTLRSTEFADVLVDGRDVTLDEILVDPVRFWRPCFESMSPFHSFARVRYRDQLRYVLYPVASFPRLTEARCTPGAARTTTPVGFIVNR
ncbi:MAG: hypothetical protein QOD51_1905 [Candidatus Eremiobacteraeota bacterium]|nr:hypothetical protein [Candidatus Eremiobacteraeota bacterium]